MRTRSIAWVIAAVLLIGAGCSSGGNGSKTAASTTSGSGAAQDVAADKAIAQQATLQLGDFPTGWDATAPRPPTANNDLFQQLADCLHVDRPVLGSDNPTRARSDDFSHAQDQTQASSRVVFESTLARGQQQMAILKKPEARECFVTAVKTVFADNLLHPRPGQTPAADVKVGNVTVETLPLTKVGDDSVAYRVTVGVDAAGVHVDAILDLVSFIKGRAAVNMAYQGVGSPFPPDPALQLAQTVAGRLPAA
jgi:hypothetical protein